MSETKIPGIVTESTGPSKRGKGNKNVRPDDKQLDRCLEAAMKRHSKIAIVGEMSPSSERFHTEMVSAALSVHDGIIEDLAKDDDLLKRLHLASLAKKNEILSGDIISIAMRTVEDMQREIIAAAIEEWETLRP